MNNILSLLDNYKAMTTPKMSEKRCKETFDEVYQNCDDLLINDITTK